MKIEVLVKWYESFDTCQREPISKDDFYCANDYADARMIRSREEKDDPTCRLLRIEEPRVYESFEKFKAAVEKQFGDNRTFGRKNLTPQGCFKLVWPLKSEGEFQAWFYRKV